MPEVAFETDLRRLDEFSARDLYTMLKMRVDVFVVEQKCPYPELDGLDEDALHIRLLAGDDLLASGRIHTASDESSSVHIGRVVVSPKHRGKRLGEHLMSEAINACERLYPGRAIALSAQSHLRGFYAAFGFVPVSDEYLEDGIPHIDMKRPLGRAVA